MLDKLLITLDDFKPFKDLSENMDRVRIDEYIRDTQVIELRQFLGAKLYFTLIDQFDAEDNEFPVLIPSLTDLWFGVDIDGVRFYGLKPMLIQYTYARIMLDININITRTGVRQFNQEESEAVPESIIMAKVNTARSTGLVYQEDAEAYLNKYGSKYPTWAPTEIKTTGPTFFKI